MAVFRTTTNLLYKSGQINVGTLMVEEDFQDLDFLKLSERGLVVLAGPAAPPVLVEEVQTPEADEDEDLESLTKRELKELALDAGLTGASRMNKNELIAALEG